MRILVIGSGAREHALCWKIAQSTRCSQIFCAPGNGGIRDTAEVVEIAADDVDRLLKFAKDKHIDLTVVGPELPLVKGIVDTFLKAGLKIFGPTRAVAAIEGSKIFAKELMKRAGVPTADFRAFDKIEDAVKYVSEQAFPVVIKADGLCAGKGVVIAHSFEEARETLNSMMVDKVFGAAGEKVIVEECLAGEEASIIVVSDGKNVVPMASSQDHKRIFDFDRGANTGGMGAYSPAPVINDVLFDEIMLNVIHPVINTLAKEGAPYKGVLYAGVMVTKKGPFVLEFNARFGDPETQAILPRMRGDLVELMDRASSGSLEGYNVSWDPRPCVTVVMASGGYPGAFSTGMEIRGLEDAKRLGDVMVFHAGTRRGRRSTDGDNTVITCGGRVLGVTALGSDLRDAADRCYTAVRMIYFDSMHYRRDIGAKALKPKL